MARNMSRSAALQPQIDKETVSEERWDPADIRLAAIALVAKLPTHSKGDALAIIDQARTLVMDYVFKAVA